MIKYKLLFMLITLAFLIINCTKSENWEILFDGTSTDAWRAFHRETFPDSGWTVENGILKTIVGGDEVDIITNKTYLNFELELEWKVTPGGNSGIFYHVNEKAPSVWESAPEIQVLDDTQHKDGKNTKTSAGTLYGLIAPTENKVLMPVGEFNKVRLLVKNNHVEHWLNGIKIVEYELGSDSLKSLIAQSKFKDKPLFANGKQGHIALQHHHDEVGYRNIRIRSLDN